MTGQDATCEKWTKCEHSVNLHFELVTYMVIYILVKGSPMLIKTIHTHRPCVDVTRENRTKYHHFVNVHTILDYLSTW